MLANGSTAMEARVRRLPRTPLLERRLHLGHRLKALAGDFAQAARHDLGRALRAPASGARLVAQDRAHAPRRRVARERALAGQHLVEHRAEAEDIRARVERLALRLLRRHVGHRADHRAVHRLRHVGAAAADQLRQAEIEQLDGPLRVTMMLRRLQIAVEDALAVRGFERAGDLNRQPHARLRGQRAAQRLRRRCTPSPDSPGRRRRSGRCADGSAPRSRALPARSGRVLRPAAA